MRLFAVAPKRGTTYSSPKRRSHVRQIYRHRDPVRDMTQILTGWPYSACESCLWQVSCDWFICVTWRIHMCSCMIMCYVTRLCVRHDSFICATWPIYVCDIKHPYVRQNHLLCTLILRITSVHFTNHISPPRDLTRLHERHAPQTSSRKCTHTCVWLLCIPREAPHAHHPKSALISSIWSSVGFGIRIVMILHRIQYE